MPDLPAAQDARFDRLCELTRERMARLPIPGAALGVYADGVEHTAAFGVTNLDHPLPITAETLFQVGSITKTFVATAAMRLAQMDRLDLDRPLREILPGLRMADPDTQARLTFTHLLTHTGGWMGDYFNDFGPGDDALQRMVAEVGRLPQITPVGEVYSYNNAGFYLAGRVLEVLTGLTFEKAIQELVLDPLGMRSSFFFPEQLMTYRFVAGHEVVDGQPRVARPWGMGRASYPAGALVTNIPDLLRYARFHLGSGTAPDGTRLLSQAALAELRSPRFPSSGLNWIGLSWVVIPLENATIFGHGGATNGQEALLRLVADQDFAVAVLTNSDYGSILANELANAATREFRGVSLPQAVPVPLSDSERAPLLGRYEASAQDLILTARENGELTLQVEYKGGFPTPDSPPPQSPPPVRAACCGPDQLVVLEYPLEGNRGEFVRGPGGEVLWLRLSGRVHRKV